MCQAETVTLLVIMWDERRTDRCAISICGRRNITSIISKSSAKNVDFDERLTDVEATRKKKTKTQMPPGRMERRTSLQKRNSAAKNASPGMIPWIKTKDMQQFSTPK